MSGCASACRARCSTSGVDAGRPRAVRRRTARSSKAPGPHSWTSALPHASLAIPVYYLVANAEASSNLARFDGVRYGTRADDSSLSSMYYKTRARFGAEVKRRIMIGTFVLSAGYYDAYYVKAQQVRALIRKDYDEAFATRGRRGACRRARRSRSSWGSGPTIRCRCICRTCSPRRRTWPDCRRSACRAA